MFTFHKPRVYRSAEGCCICRAKSSSSRFTDSKKYEEDSIKCFDLKEPRQGEICNACVLLVKRYKRLPTGSTRHWGHVVDARAGPGMKSMTKCKKLKEESAQPSNHCSSDRNHNHKSLIPEKFSKIFKKNKKKVVKEKNKSAMNSKQWETQPLPLPLTPESLDSDLEEVQYSPTKAIESASNKIRLALNRSGSNRRKCLPPKKFRSNNHDKVQFFDENLWVKRKSCCGFVLENQQLGAIILDVEDHIPCAEHRRKPIEISEKSVPLQLSTQQQYNTNTKSGPPHQMSFNPPANRNSTPVLKKHHLFFKRQSESFPLGDMKQLNNTNPQKTDFLLDIKVLPTTIPTSSAVKVAKLNPVNINSHTTSHSNATSHLGLTTGKVSQVPFEQQQPPQQQQQQTVHKNSSKSNSFMHKVKSDTGKIIKHSLEKFNTLRLKPSELADVKNMVKTMDKSFVVKPVAAVSQEKPKKSDLDNVPGASNQPAATKFNDNSSDSGFDENLQSVSPLQDDTDKKVMTIPVQTMYLASGVQIHGQHPNLLLAGNEMAAKILQNRKAMQNSRNGLKIAQIVASGGGSQKMHAIYSQPQEGAIITAAAVPPSSASASTSNIIAIPPATCTTAPSSHLSKTPTNIILSGNPASGANVLSTSVPSLNQKIILVKTKYNSNNNNQQSACKN